jgi:hypothetical protein
MRGRRLPRWWALPLEMLSICTCYSRLHWWWFGYMSPSYCTTWPSLVHVSSSYWTTCQVLVVLHVSFLLAHVSCCGWITCQFFIGPCVVFLLVHVAISYLTTSHGVVRSHFVFLFGHVASHLHSTCRISIAHMSCPGYSTCHALFVHVSHHMACPSSTSWSTINSS